MRVVVTGLIGGYPLGGVAWDYLAYVKGFLALGADVLYLEDTGQWLYDPRSFTFTDDVTFNVGYLREVLRCAGSAMDDHWSLRAPDGTYHGRDEAGVGRFCRGADLFLNVSGCCWLRESYRGARRTAYLDTDPGYSQSKLEAAQRGTASGDDAYSVGLILAHDRFLTFAENLGATDCRIPTCGLDWRTTRQPLVLEDWPMSYRPQAEAFTTVMSWKTDVTPPVLGGVAYGGKDVEFRRFADLPRRSKAVLEIAVAGKAPDDDLRQRGWRVVDASSRSATMDDYRDYLAGSRGECSVAKQAYVATRSGWFSCRSACYLALGKPAIVEDTGFSRMYPTGAGLFAFSSVDEAAVALEAVESDYRGHCEAARAVAEAEFDSGVVLQRLLTAVDL